jgi:hypothetical protein
VSVELPFLIDNARLGHGGAAADVNDLASQRTVPASRVSGRVRFIFSSRVVNRFPAGMVELIEHPSAVSRSVAANPPWATPVPL